MWDKNLQSNLFDLIKSLYGQKNEKYIYNYSPAEYCRMFNTLEVHVARGSGLTTSLISILHDDMFRNKKVLYVLNNEERLKDHKKSYCIHNPGVEVISLRKLLEDPPRGGRSYNYNPDFIILENCTMTIEQKEEIYYSYAKKYPYFIFLNSIHFSKPNRINELHSSKNRNLEDEAEYVNSHLINILNNINDSIEEKGIIEFKQRRGYDYKRGNFGNIISYPTDDINVTFEIPGISGELNFNKKLLENE